MLALAGLAGCDAQARKEKEARERAQSPQAQQRVKALLDKTRQQMVFVAGGGFWLGDFGLVMDGKAKANNQPPGPDAKLGENLPFTSDEDNKPPKWVTLDGYSLQSHKVTYDDFDVYVMANALPAHPPEGDETRQRIWRRSRLSGDTPADVTWHQAKAYCQWLGKVTGLPFDLPTEAQWEYAASSRTNSYRHPYPTQTGLLEEDVTHPSYEKKKSLQRGRFSVLYPVGRFSPSKLGFYDLVGNGFDWVNDWYAADAYQHGPVHNPLGPRTGTEKVHRGMSSGDGWTFGFPHLSRYHSPPEGKTNSKGERHPPIELGFRCALNQPTALAASASAASK
jgi:formylglycine-generating enzyme required for sulfatase activity